MTELRNSLFSIDNTNWSKISLFKIVTAILLKISLIHFPNNNNNNNNNNNTNNNNDDDDANNNNNNNM